jgi:hypothetical protein
MESFNRVGVWFVSTNGVVEYTHALSHFLHCRTDELAAVVGCKGEAYTVAGEDVLLQDSDDIVDTCRLEGPCLDPFGGELLEGEDVAKSSLGSWHVHKVGCKLGEAWG